MQNGVGKRVLRSETSGGVVTETWKGRMLKCHCWRGRRSTMRIALVAKLTEPKS